eukprot:1853789-Rhodomonas_salina.1
MRRANPVTVSGGRNSCFTNNCRNSCDAVVPRVPGYPGTEAKTIRLLVLCTSVQLSFIAVNQAP